MSRSAITSLRRTIHETTRINTNEADATLGQRTCEAHLHYLVPDAFAVSHYSWLRPRLVLVVLILTAIGAFGFLKRKRRLSN